MFGGQKKSPFSPSTPLESRSDYKIMKDQYNEKTRMLDDIKTRHLPPLKPVSKRLGAGPGRRMPRPSSNMSSRFSIWKRGQIN